MGVSIRQEACIGCGLCAQSCAFSALRIEEGKVYVTAACMLCGACVDSCPAGAITLPDKRGERQAGSGVWVVAEARGGEIAEVSLELVGKGRELANRLGEALYAVLMCEGAGNMPQELIACGADRVILCEGAGFFRENEPAHCDTLSALIEEYAPSVVLIGATPFGRSVAPRVAARCKTGLTADCTQLGVDEQGLLVQTRPAFGGNLMASILCPDARPQMATVRAGVLPRPDRQGGRRGEIIRTPARGGAGGIKLIEKESRPSAALIAKAKRIITAGKGIASQKNMGILYELAGLLGASVGVTRPLVDAGWGGFAQQIGQTGSAVAPDLLITFGVSGAIQHLAGIAGAKRIIAVNTDRSAPIFRVADYAVAGDCVQIAKQMISCLKSGAI